VAIATSTIAIVPDYRHRWVLVKGRDLIEPGGSGVGYAGGPGCGESSPGNTCFTARRTILKPRARLSVTIVQ